MKKAPLLLAAVFTLVSVLSGSAQDSAAKRQQSPVPFSTGDSPSVDRSDDNLFESTWMAYASLKRVVPDLVKRLDCAGKNMVLYGPEQGESLLWLRAVSEQLELVRARMKLLLDSPMPAPADAATATSVPSTPAILSGPVRQALLDLGVMLSAAGAARRNVNSDEGGLIPMVAQAAVTNGCSVYWPNQAAPNLYNRTSKLMLLLKEVGDLTDNGEVADKPAGLQQKLRALQVEVKRAETMARDLEEKIGKERLRFTEAEKKVEQVKEQIDWLWKHIEVGKDAGAQSKLNLTFSKSWDDLEAAVTRQMSQSLPQTLEEQQKIGELSKRVDVLRSQTDWLSRFSRDEMDLGIQQTLKRTLSSSFEGLSAAIKNRDSLAASLPKAIEPELKEKQRWETYAAGVKALSEVLSSVLESYSMVRKTLLNTDAGTTPLQELLRAESLRDLTFDENFRERPGASIVHLKLQKIAGTSRLKLGNNPRAGFSGGVILSFVQYDPNGKVKNSGVETSYEGFRSELP